MREYEKEINSGMVKVSVIVPVYNVEEYIEECLDSLIGQTLSDIEILLINDGSTDLSGDICDEYAQKNKNIRVIHKANQGLGNARNVGFAEAKGKYVYFIDSDDWLEKDALRVLYEESEKESLDLVLFSADCFSDDLKVKFNPEQYKRTAFLDDVKKGKDMFFCLYGAKEYYPAIPLRFYNRFFLQEKQYFFPEGILHEDEAYACLSLLEAERVKCIAATFYKRRYRKGSIMTSKKAYQSALGCIYTWKRLMEARNSLDLNDSEKKKYVTFANVFIYRVIGLYQKSFDMDDKKKFRKNRKEIQKESFIKNVDIGLRLFFASPFWYKQYEKIMRIRGNIYHLKRESELKYIFFEAIIQLFMIHTVCRDNSAAILIGTPIHGNLGDQAIVYAEYKFLERFKKKINIVEVPSQCYLKHKEFLQKRIAPQDLIIIDGGGSMGTLWIKNEYRFRDIIERFPDNRVFIFPQTAYFSEDSEGLEELKKSVRIYSQHDNLIIFCRDKTTYEFIQKEFAKNTSYYMPDMVLSIQDPVEQPEIRNGVLICLRGDKESIADCSLGENIERFLVSKGIAVKKTSTLVEWYVNKFNRDEELQKKWSEFAHSKLVITDRLHAMIFCAITQTPCIAFDNVSHKVKGGYQWIKVLPYICFIESGVPSEELIHNMLDSQERKSIDLSSEYKELQRIVEGRKQNAE